MGFKIKLSAVLYYCSLSTVTQWQCCQGGNKWLSEFRSSVHATVCEFCIDAMAVEHTHFTGKTAGCYVVGKMYVVMKWRR